MKTKNLALAIMSVAALALGGCASMPDLQGGLSDLGASAQRALGQAAAQVASAPSRAYRDYVAAAARETEMLKQFTEASRDAGEPWKYLPEKLSVRSGGLVTTTTVTKLFAAAVPATSIATDDALAVEGVRAIALYAASRPEPSKLLIVAPDVGTARWIQTHAEQALAQAGKRLDIEQRLGDQPQIGWVSTGGTGPRDL